MRLFPRWLSRHRKDDDTPYVLGGAFGILLIIIVGTFGLALAGRYMIGTGNLAAVVSSVLADLVNIDRGANNLGGLAWDDTLAKAAQAKANHMAQNSYFAHVSPDGKNSWYWFREAGYTFVYAGENLAVDFTDSADVERAWMNSPSHRANILNGNYTEIGIATAQGFYQGRMTTFAVQMFGRPAKVRAAPTPIETEVLPTVPTELATASTIPDAIETSPIAGVSVEVEEVPVPLAAVTGPIPGTTPEPITLAAVESADIAPWWEHLVASPKTTLQYLYYALAFVALVILAVVTRFELKRHHRHHLYAVAILFVIMLALFALAQFFFFAPPAIAAVP